ncbi:uncharacterized protein EURHEDRAFT_461230 [Aspergillus ruber CBS 135680]|uniref:DUF7702 domain-containing protein n=1 Tax=Aspergillus ruber (strain CBS 135680) TaxID=1388766 RepID=A0A017S8M6_ASPRC|nr:uncharacterized protein EURHEDRAFT_461230 [Aspergillus ruber CBS 135680]EYE92984.1 hypothetical protein EURHEDRAFT_461230 [Aspergillus ruber CBS 135680]
MADSLSAATCAIYVILAFPILYLLFKHGRNGFLGWLYLFVFCGLRIISGGLGVKKSDGAAASIISNIGLSPLLLATAGILHEARAYRIFGINKKLEWAQALFFHILVGAGVALAAAGSAKLQDHEQSTDKAEKMIKVGIVILAICWGVLVGWTGLSFRAPRGDGPVVRDGTMMLGSIAFCLVLIGVRVFYSLVAICTQAAYLNPSTGTLVIRVVLGFLPELLATLVYICAGIQTRGVAKLVSHGVAGYKPPAPYV